MKDKKKKKKPYRSVWSNVIWSFREMLRQTPAAFWLLVLGVPLAVFTAWAKIKLPALVVSEVVTGQPFVHAATVVGALIGALLLSDVLGDFISTVVGAYESKYRYRQCVRLQEKSMTCFYQTYEKKSTHDLADRAFQANMMSYGRVQLLEVPEQSVRLVQSVICYGLFGTIISFASPWLALFLTVTPVVNWFFVRAYQNYEYSTRGERAGIHRKRSYVSNRAADFTAAKDIRIYGMSGWLRQVFDDLFDQDIEWKKRLNIRKFLSRLPDLCVILIRDGAAYAVLIAMSVQGKISVDQFVMYFAAISGFAGHISDILSSWIDMHAASLNVCDFREYMDLPEEDGSGRARADDHISHAPEITFDHVSFRYDGAEEDTIRDISLTLHPGERVALVGINGAGKTTLVKLLCGLYRPTSGEIRIDGVPVDDFRHADYYRLFSPVFQNVRTAFFSLAETVAAAGGDRVDRARAEECMRRAGLGRKLDSLPDGIDTKLDKQVNKDGIALSGGEAQKLVMARALYKDAPVLVLDEPTAALDPIAENEIYMQYRDMTGGKTSLFISHRLASTRFCDRILYLDHGKIIEEGTHDELIARGGEYARLFEIQSCWYRDDYRGESCDET